MQNHVGVSLLFLSRIRRIIYLLDNIFSVHFNFPHDLLLHVLVFLLLSQ